MAKYHGGERVSYQGKLGYVNAVNYRTGIASVRLDTGKQINDLKQSLISRASKAELREARERLAKADAHAARKSSGTHSPDLDKIQERKAMRTEQVHPNITRAMKDLNIKGNFAKISPYLANLVMDQVRDNDLRDRVMGGGGGGGDQPRVPAGSSDGGQWTKG